VEMCDAVLMDETGDPTEFGLAADEIGYTAERLW
jgi:hypothetical protein